MNEANKGEHYEHSTRILLTSGRVVIVVRPTRSYRGATKPRGQATNRKSSRKYLVIA